MLNEIEKNGEVMYDVISLSDHELSFMISRDDLTDRNDEKYSYAKCEKRVEEELYTYTTVLFMELIETEDGKKFNRLIDSVILVEDPDNVYYAREDDVIVSIISTNNQFPCDEINCLSSGIIEKVRPGGGWERHKYISIFNVAIDDL